MSFSAYLDYKESGNQWIGTSLPEHWQVRRLKSLVAEPLKYGANESAEDEDRSQPRFVRITDINDDGGLRDETFKSLPAEIAEPYLLQGGDVLLARSGATVGKSFIYSENWGIACFAGYLIRARLRTSECMPRWVYYFCQTDDYWGYVVGSQIQATIQNVSAEKYANLYLPLPPLDEQRAITSFLDTETSKIDGLVSEQRRLIELLKEKRQAVISHAVTKGLNPNAPMKPSGIQWLGDLPEHWSAEMLSRVTSKIGNGFVGPTRDILVESGVPYIQATHIKKGRVNFDGSYFVTKEWADWQSKAALELDDVLIVQTGAGTGDIGLVSKEEVGYRCHALIIVRSVKSRLLGSFLSIALKSQYGRQTLESIQTGGMHPHLNCGNVKFVYVPVPPTKEQTDIVEYVNNQATKFDTLEAEAERAIELLQERRTALISAAVTGKIDVREFTPVSGKALAAGSSERLTSKVLKS